MNERQEKLLSVCNAKNFVYLKDLQEIFPNVSLMTLRRDIETLANEGRLVKIRGGARRAEWVSSVEENFNVRALANEQAKTKIALLAATLINQNSCYFFDSGSTIWRLAKVTPDYNISVFTTGTNVAAELAQKQNVAVYISGGSLNKNNLSLSGTIAMKSLIGINIDTAFMVASGYAPNSEFTCGNCEEAQLKQFIISRSKKVVMLLDDSKLSKSLTYTFCAPENIDIIISNSTFPVEYLRHIKKRNEQIKFI